MTTSSTTTDVVVKPLPVFLPFGTTTGETPGPQVSPRAVLRPLSEVISEANSTPNSLGSKPGSAKLQTKGVVQLLTPSILLDQGTPNASFNKELQSVTSSSRSSEEAYVATYKFPPSPLLESPGSQQGSIKSEERSPGSPTSPEGEAQEPSDTKQKVTPPQLTVGITVGSDTSLLGTSPGVSPSVSEIETKSACKFAATLVRECQTRLKLNDGIPPPKFATQLRRLWEESTGKPMPDSMSDICAFKRSSHGALTPMLSAVVNLFASCLAPSKKTSCHNCNHNSENMEKALAKALEQYHQTYSALIDKQTQSVQEWKKEVQRRVIAFNKNQLNAVEDLKTKIKDVYNKELIQYKEELQASYNKLADTALETLQTFTDTAKRHEGVIDYAVKICNEVSAGISQSGSGSVVSDLDQQLLESLTSSFSPSIEGLRQSRSGLRSALERNRLKGNTAPSTRSSTDSPSRADSPVAGQSDPSISYAPSEVHTPSNSSRPLSTPSLGKPRFGIGLSNKATRSPSGSMDDLMDSEALKVGSAVNGDAALFKVAGGAKSAMKLDIPYMPASSQGLPVASN